METKLITAETWGESLARHVGRKFAPMSAELNAAFGVLGSRAQFDKLKQMQEAPANADDVLRAWLLLSMSGFDPADFGVLDEALPPAMDAAYLRRQVRALRRKRRSSRRDSGGDRGTTMRDLPALATL